MSIVPFKDSIPPGEPNAELVRTLEGLLADARSGKLRAMGFAVVRSDWTVATGWDGSGGDKYHLGASISLLDHRYANAILGPEE